MSRDSAEKSANSMYVCNMLMGTLWHVVCNMLMGTLWHVVCDMLVGTLWHVVSEGWTDDELI